eukprot:6192991-Pleurochrysis_carterae.AAC.3
MTTNLRGLLGAAFMRDYAIVQNGAIHVCAYVMHTWGVFALARRTRSELTVEDVCDVRLLICCFE